MHNIGLRKGTAMLSVTTQPLLIAPVPTLGAGAQEADVYPAEQALDARASSPLRFLEDLNISCSDHTNTRCPRLAAVFSNRVRHVHVLGYSNLADCGGFVESIEDLFAAYFSPLRWTFLLQVTTPRLATSSTEGPGPV